jgi:hypothetical protein
MTKLRIKNGKNNKVIRLKYLGTAPERIQLCGAYMINHSQSVNFKLNFEQVLQINETSPAPFMTP